MYGKDDCLEINLQQKSITEEQEQQPAIEEVIWAINSLKNGRSPACDEITAELIKAGEGKSAQIYHVLCNTIWKSGPKEWK
jgi:hypothetical protein